eukprot:Skav229195  [mRNA]  locus=scaffold1004:463169:464095:+ [translate_table: standard]
MMGVDHSFVSWVRVQTSLHEALGLVHSLAKVHHQRLHRVAEVGRLFCQRAVGLGSKGALQFLQVIQDALIDCLATASQFVEALVLLKVLGARGHDAGLGHLHHGLHLAAHGGDVILIHHFLTCLGFLLGVDLQGLQKFLVLSGVPCGNSLGCGVQVGQAALAGLNGPLSAVAVAGEDHVFVLLEDLCHSIAMAHATFDQTCKVFHACRHDGVAHHHWETAVLRAAHSAELETIATEGEGRSTISILHVGFDVHGGTATSGLLLLLSFVPKEVATCHNALYELLEALSRIQRDDGWWSFLCTQAVVVPS